MDQLLTDVKRDKRTRFKRLVRQFWYIPCYFFIYLGITIPFFVMYREAYWEKDKRISANIQAVEKSKDEYVLCDPDKFYVIKDQMPLCLSCQELYSGCTSCEINENEDKTVNDNGYIKAFDNGEPDHSRVVVCKDDLS